MSLAVVALLCMLARGAGSADGAEGNDDAELLQFARAREQLCSAPTPCGGSVVVGFANSGYSKFALNWVLSMRHVGLENFVLVALDKRVHAYFGRLVRGLCADCLGACGHEAYAPRAWAGLFVWRVPSLACYACSLLTLLPSMHPKHDTPLTLTLCVHRVFPASIHRRSASVPKARSTTSRASSAISCTSACTARWCSCAAVSMYG